MRDYPEKLRMIARRQTLLRDEHERVLLGSATEIERLREAIVEWADAIDSAEGTLFLDKVPSKKLIEEILELAAWKAR
jgi:hypothetical protein